MVTKNKTKRFFLLLVIGFLACSKTFSTEQVSDVLIIGNDTVYLKSFPLESLIEQQILKFPFTYGEYLSPSTNCYRGYIATWQIMEEMLVLKDVVKLDSLGTRLNIVEYFENNGYNPKLKDNYVIADWYSDTLKSYDFFRSNYAYTLDDFYVSKDFLKNQDKRIELLFEKGKLITNNIIPIQSYQIGDTLSFDVHYNQDWWLWVNSKSVQLTGIVMNNNGKKVRLKIIAWGGNKKQINKKVQREVTDMIWVNPRYCKKID